mgnify:CR=1 FL=1
MGIIETIASIKELHSVWHVPSKSLLVDAIIIEDKANGPAIIEVLQKEFSCVIPIEPRGSKIARALSVAPQIEAGSVWVKNEPWGDEVIDYWTFLPNGSEWDDIDATSQALDYLSTYEITEGSIFSANMASSHVGLN